MRPISALLSLACLLCVSFAACGGSSSSIPNPFQPNPSPSPSPAIPTPPPNPTPIQIVGGDVVGAQVFPAGDTSSGGQGANVDGIPCDKATSPYNVHAHVTLFHNGKQIAIPIAIGIMKPVYNAAGN
jgi:hypothetical protein